MWFYFAKAFHNARLTNCRCAWRYIGARMHKIILLFLVWSPLGFCFSSLTEDSFNGVKIGESSSAALKKLPGYIEEKFEESGECYYLSGPESNSTASFMVVSGVVSRIDVYNENIQTSKGIAIGSNKSDVLKIYKNVNAWPHPYDAPEGEYLEVKLSNGLGIIFETHKDVITSFRLGSYPAVELKEGCL